MDWHGIPVLLTFCFMILDVVSGTLKAAVTRTLSSGKAREGIWHKASYILVILLAELIEIGMTFAEAEGFDLGFELPLVVPSCVLICLTETMSIIENAAEMNPDLRGSRLLDLFNHDKGGEDADDDLR